MTKKSKKKNFGVKNAKAPTKRLNLFELHINRRKYDVLGMKSKAEKGLPGISRAKSIKKRKGTLLQEYKIKNKKNLFYDRRIGERNSAMTAEDKMIARFTAERMKHHSKKSIYNLGNDEELTHKGQTLTEIEKFDDPKSDDEEDNEEDGRLDSDFVEDAHFGGGIFKKVDGEPKSRKDLIDQLIAESIKRKAEKQKLRQDTYDMTEKLDSDWKELLPLVTVTKKSKSDPEPENKKDDKFANYDVLSKKLKFEARGKPSDRLKSEEEIAKEEKEKLENLEKDRIKRMLGDNLACDAMKHRSADDMDDGFDLENQPEPILAYDNGVLNSFEINNSQVSENKKETIDSINSEEDEESEDEKSEESDESENEKEEKSEDEDEENNYSDLKESDESDVEVKNNSIAKEKCENVQKLTKKIEKILTLPLANQLNGKSGKNKEENINEETLRKAELEMEAARKELPFTFQIPKEYEEFETLMKKYQESYQSVIVERMIKCHHPSLNEEHKKDLEILFTFLLQFIQDCSFECETKNNCFKTLDKLSPWLFDLVQWNPSNSSSAIMEVIREKYDDFLKNPKKFPPLDTLIFFKVVSLLFPTSDYRHAVATPTLIFMSEILFRSKIESSTDVSCGLFVTTLVLEYCTFSKRFSPEAINFLHSVLRLAKPKDPKAADSFDLIVRDKHAVTDIGKLRTEDLFRSNSSENFKVNAVSLALKLLSEFCDFWTEGQSAILIFEPFVSLLNESDFSACLKPQIDEVLEKILKFKSEKLKMLVLKQRKPKPLRLYEPNIEEVHDFKKRPPMGKRKAERAKLLHKYKREMKGALREIRRDRSFLSKLKYKETVISDAERKRKVQEILSSAAEQQGELRKIQRKKK